MAIYQAVSHQSCNKSKPIIRKTCGETLPCLVEKMQLLCKQQDTLFLSDGSVLQTLYQEQETRVRTQVWSIRSYLGSKGSGQFSINCTNLHRRQHCLIELSRFQKVIHFAYSLFSCIPKCSLRCCLRCTTNSASVGWSEMGLLRAGF